MDRLEAGMGRHYEGEFANHVRKDGKALKVMWVDGL